ncbi:cysteine desulfurase family protein [Candidatus Mycolicibacterium alkanivorans]|uniref:cysteine desulfurase n=1 Tax=Candidatus Mycolicibacterium alkanivorans TaxID=2954114 RepID=A0ABS9YR13_9MYCO|nr:cysteine desulfurase family protein [Candidatus Mycolicibacterium alkanivorans]MCI4673628.1 cysteine desulfurase [Candidatus Mycolicibacterium alkanivorans]
MTPGDIYLDYNATTPVDPRVLDAMLPMLTDSFANPASKHAAGCEVARRIESARRDVAALVGADRRDIVFTSGATESAMFAIHGALASAPPERRRILVASTEHRAVLSAADASGKADVIHVLPDGTLDLDYLDWLIGPDVALVAVAAANNETGVINDLGAIGEIAHRAGALLFSDITQAVGRIPVDIAQLPVDLAVWSAHKLYGPKGVGAVATARGLRTRLQPLFPGSAERGLRGGTLNTAGIAGFGAASRIAAEEMDSSAARHTRLTTLLQTLLERRVGARLNGQGAPRLPNTVNLWFPGAPAEAVQDAAPDVLVSAGSACASGDTEPSHVLLAMGLSPDAALESLRFSLGRPTTEDDIRLAADRIADAARRVRSMEREGRP